MATKTVTKYPELELETSLHEAFTVSTIFLWINEARMILDRVRDCSRIDPELAKRLKENCIPINVAEWDDDTAEGMSTLIFMQRVAITNCQQTSKSMKACRG